MIACETIPFLRRAPRFEDRRDSPRTAMHFFVRPEGSDVDSAEVSGDLSLGGLAFFTRAAPEGTRFHVRFSLPGQTEPVEAVAEVIRHSVEGSFEGTHLRFAEISVREELAIARYLHGHAERDAA